MTGHGLAILILAFATMTSECAQQDSATATAKHCSVSGDLEIRSFSSKVFRNTRKLRVWLPPGYRNAEEQNRRYPVFYLNDGEELFDVCTSIFGGHEWHADETAASLIGNHAISPMILVGIDNAGKADRPKEYLPYPDETLTPPVRKVFGSRYPEFLLKEVMPWVNREYRTETDPEQTGLGGSSYGAGIALYTVMTHPNAFGRLLMESPSIYADDYHLLRIAKKVRTWPRRVFIGVGTVGEPLEDVAKLEKLLRGAGLGERRLCVVRTEGTEHNEDAWAKRFPDALQFLYGEGTAAISDIPGRAS